VEEVHASLGPAPATPHAISARAAHGYSEVELKRFSGHLSVRSPEVYIAHNREAAKRKAGAWERNDSKGR